MTKILGDILLSLYAEIFWRLLLAHCFSNNRKIYVGKVRKTQTLKIVGTTKTSNIS